MYELIHRKESEKARTKEQSQSSPGSTPFTAEHSTKRKPSRYEQLTGVATPEEIFTQRLQRMLKGDEDAPDKVEAQAKPLSIQREPEEAPVTVEDREKTSDISRTAQQLTGAFTASPQTESKIDSMRKSGGTPLDGTTRDFMESRMGHDFGDVRVHTGSDAESTSQDLQAKAYTVGKDIAFNKGEYQPETQEGKKLLAHELTHTIQQGAVRRKIQKKVTHSSGESTKDLSSRTDRNQKQIQRTPEKVQRAPASRRRQIRSAIYWNRRHHRYTKGLAFELYKLARKKEPYFRLRKRPGINENFVWLVGEVQANLGIHVNGRLDERTIRAAVKFRGGGKLGWLASMLLNMAYKLVRSIPKWMFLHMGPLGAIFVKGLEGFLDKLRRTNGRDLASLILKTARALTSWAFAKNFILGFLKGFFVDGLLGVFVMIWELIQIPAQLKQYANSLVKRLGDFSISKNLASIYSEAANQVNWLSRNRGWLWDKLYSMVFSTKSKRLGNIVSRIAGFVGGFAKKTGGKIASMLLDFFGGSSKKIGASLGSKVGTATGYVGFEALIAILTVGGSAGITAAKTVLRPLISAVSKGLKHVLKYAKIIYNAVAGVAAKMTKWLLKTLRKISPKLGERFGKLFSKIKQFFDGVFARFRRGPRGKGKKAAKSNLQGIAMRAARLGWNKAKAGTRSEIKNEGELKSILRKVRLPKSPGVRVRISVARFGKKWRVAATATKGSKRGRWLSGNGWIMLDRKNRPWFANRSQERFHKNLNKDTVAKMKSVIKQIKKEKKKRKVSLRTLYQNFARQAQKLQKQAQTKLTGGLKGINYRIELEPFSKVKRDSRVYTKYIVQPNIEEFHVDHVLGTEHEKITAKLLEHAGRIRLRVDRENPTKEEFANVAVAYLDLPGLTGKRIWREVSGSETIPDERPFKEKDMPERKPPFQSNLPDAEHKILLKLVTYLQKKGVPEDAEGTLYIYTEKEMCRGCVSSASSKRKWHKYFKHIEPIVLWSRP